MKLTGKELEKRIIDDNAREPFIGRTKLRERYEKEGYEVDRTEIKDICNKYGFC